MTNWTVDLKLREECKDRFVQGSGDNSWLNLAVCFMPGEYICLHSPCHGLVTIWRANWWTLSHNLESHGFGRKWIMFCIFMVAFGGQTLPLPRVIKHLPPYCGQNSPEQENDFEILGYVVKQTQSYVWVRVHLSLWKYVVLIKVFKSRVEVGTKECSSQNPSLPRWIFL